MKSLVLSALLIFAVISANAQAVIGTAEQLSCNCFRLTEAQGNEAGAVWNTSQIDLSNPFDYTFDVYLGDNNAGADGIAFVLQPLDTGLVETGGGIGYQYISPSVAMVIDTWDNGVGSPTNPQNDIPEDHVAIMANGSIDHGSADNLAGPEIALVSGGNIEDDAWHVMRVSWNPTTMLINFYIDGSLRTSYTGDIVTDIFGGDPNVYWGFTASTGGANNVQEFCFSIIPGVENLATDEICAGDSIEFVDDSYSALGDVVAWAWDFDNGLTSADENPGYVQFNAAGNFTIEQRITDVEGCDTVATFDITVHPNPEADFTSTDVCQGDEMDLVDQSTVSSGAVSDWDWDLGNGETDFGSSIGATYQDAGIYDVTLNISTAEGCVDSVTAPVTVFENPVADGGFESTSLEAVFTTDLNAGEDAYWIVQDTAFTTDGTFNYTFPDSGFYDVALVVTNDNGCVDTSFYSIYIEGLPEYEIPNVFTPNGDDLNERFQPETYAVSEAIMKVFNRWGRPVFTYEGAVPPIDSWGWDGTVNGGAKAAAGTYYYVLDLKGVNGDNFSEKGTVTLLR